MMERILEPVEALCDADADTYDRLSRKHRFCLDNPFIGKVLSMGIRQGQALDIGCGPGHVAVDLARRCPNMTVYALDLSETMLNLVRRNAEKAGVGHRVVPILGDATRLPFQDQRFQLVVSLHTLHHVPNPELALREIRRVLAPDGAFLVRDLRRPRSPLVTKTLVNGFGALLRYGSEEKRQYWNSLRAALTPEEMAGHVRQAGLGRSRISRRAGHHLDVARKPRLCAARSAMEAPMKTRRPIAINNSLSHGICNCNCTLCGVNKPGYKGPKEFQPKSVTETLVARIKQAARQGLLVRYVANAGDGEPTLHPEFGERMDMFGDMIRQWDVPDAPTPEVSVVTNGVRLLRPGVLDAFTRNPLTLIVSFPTPDPESYGMLMSGDPRRGPALLKHVVPGIREALKLYGQGRIRRVQFHISPPDRDVVRRDFDRTLQFLTTLAREAGAETVEAILFPATANRSGLIRSTVKGCDMYADLIRRYNGKRIGGVQVRLSLSFQRFFPRIREFFDLLRAYDYPCTWNAQLFVTAAGDSTCCNDQAVRNPMGNLLHASLPELMANKERHRPGRVCAGCDQTPDKITGSRLFALFGRLAMLKLRRAEAKSTRTAPGLPALEPDGM